jgi:hypothetical protein
MPTLSLPKSDQRLPIIGPTPYDAVRGYTATYGDEGKAVVVTPSAAFLFDQHHAERLAQYWE